MEHVDLTAVDAVLLDMDGTLVDSDAAVERSWHRWADEFAVDPAEVLAIANGSPAETTVRRVCPGLDAAGARAAAGRQLQFEYEDLADVTATPGAHRLLSVLDRLGIAWAVVTSADARLARLRLGAAAIRPPVLVTFEDVTAGKPDPEGYSRAARLLGVPPARCLVVEDAEPGIRAGHDAGMPVAALRGLPGDLTIRDLAELAERFTRRHPGAREGIAPSN
jgi:mannitol-1-/sugar-/sorbitol-6-phosphatase